MKILLLEHASGRSQRIQQMIHSIDPNIEVINIELYNNVLLPNYRNFDAIITGGGPMGVYEMDKPKYEFIKQEISFLSDVIKAQIPILGICFGHQLLAHIMGGKVIKDPTHAEYGWIPITINEKGNNSPLFQKVSSPFVIFEYHGDRVIEKPSSATVLATSHHGDQAFVYKGNKIWSTQFHPETTVSQGKEILSLTRKNLEGLGYDVDQILQHSDENNQSAGKQIIQNFIQTIV